MQAPPLPPNEKERLAALHDFQILDTPPDPVFDRLTALASEIFHVPIALVSLVDSNRQWFKSCVGLGARETGRDISFCGHSILQDDVFVVPDATKDPRFADNPLVTGAPDIRFYAGAQLRTHAGFVLGTLCIIDRRARPPLTDSEKRILADLANLVVEATEEMRRVRIAGEARAERLSSRLDAVTHSSIDAVMTVDQTGAIVAWNRAAERMFGWSEAEALGAPITIVIPPSYHAPHHSGFARVIATGHSELAGKLLELTARHKDGTEFPIELTLAVWRDGDATMFGSIIRDISRRKRLEGERERARAQAELARERAEAASRAKDRLRMQLDAVLYSSIDAVLVADAKGDIVAWNRAARTMFGWEEYEALGAPITIIIPPTYHAPHHSGFAKVVATGHSNLAGKLLELTARRKDGTQFPIELTLSVWKEGDAAMFGAIMRDISGRKTLEAERARALADAEQAREAAETASRAKSSFLAMMGHELRTPLNAVIGFSEMMANEVLGSIGNETYREYSQDIVGSGNHLLGVINDVLDYATIDNGAVKLHPEAIAVAELVGEAEQIMSLQAGKRLIAMKISLTPDLPVFVGDRHKLRQVLLNLLGNAIKFTDPGGSITVTAERRRDGAIAIAVSDTGIGMSPEDAAHALEPFFQADGALSRKYEGVGLGLAIARQLVELHGGVLTLDSQVNKGTTVTFTLPPTTAPAQAAHFDI